MAGPAGSVLDASALLAYLQGEPGSQSVQEALAEGAVISVVNYAEVRSWLGDAGADPAAVDRQLREQGLIGGLLEIVPLTVDDAIMIARLRPATRAQGLSLGDRACLATGLRLRSPVVTADRSWAMLTAWGSVKCAFSEAVRPAPVIGDSQTPTPGVRQRLVADFLVGKPPVVVRLPSGV